MHQYKKFKERAFALPTLVIVSTILLIAGMSSLQAASSIGKSLQDIRWNSLANSAAEAGINYAASCLEEDAEVYEDWGSNPLKPNTNCEGGSPSGSVYIESDENGRWRSTFSVANIPQGGYDPPKIISTGTVQRLNSTGGVIKTYQAKKDILLNLPGANPIPAQSLDFGTTSYAPNAYASSGIAYSSGPCIISTDSKLYCTINYASPSIDGFPDHIAHVIDGGGLSSLTIRQAAAGVGQACALASNNQVYCLGANGAGQLGNGNTTNQSSPVQFILPSSPTGITAKAVMLNQQNLLGSLYMCVLASNNQLYCAGSNGAGQLGNGTSTSQATPVRFGLSTSPSQLTVKSAALSFWHTCVLASDNQVYCAGENGYGQLGNGVDNNDELNPVKFNLPTSPTALTAKAVAVSSDLGGVSGRKPAHTCVLASDNQVYCAGRNYNGQLGTGNTTDLSTAAEFDLPGSSLTAKQISVGQYHTCVLASNNQVYCAGNNSNGQLGDGTTTNRSSPVEFDLPGSSLTVKRVVAVSNNTCALASNNQVYCSGSNQYGQLGDGTTTNRSSPVEFDLPGSDKTAINVLSSGMFTCVLASNTQVYCAGANDYGRLGSGDDNNPQTSIKPILY